MKRLCCFFSLVAALLLNLNSAAAEPLEVNMALTPTVLQDAAYEAFSEDDLSALRMGVDLRFEVANLDGFKLLPLLGWRIATDEGYPYQASNTELLLNDLFLGLRVRKGILSWLGVFVEAQGGLTWVDIEAKSDMEMHGALAQRQDYKDSQLTWAAGGHAGIELQIPKSWLRKRNVKKFNFGGELSAGYIRRGDIDFHPKLEQGPQNAIQANTQPWGNLNTSGWTIQIAANFRFF